MSVLCYHVLRLLLASWGGGNDVKNRIEWAGLFLWDEKMNLGIFRGDQWASRIQNPRSAFLPTSRHRNSRRHPEQKREKQRGFAGESGPGCPLASDLAQFQKSLASKSERAKGRIDRRLDW